MSSATDTATSAMPSQRRNITQICTFSNIFKVERDWGRRGHAASHLVKHVNSCVVYLLQQTCYAERIVRFPGRVFSSLHSHSMSPRMRMKEMTLRWTSWADLTMGPGGRKSLNKRVSFAVTKDIRCVSTLFLFRFRPNHFLCRIFEANDQNTNSSGGPPQLLTNASIS